MSMTMTTKTTTIIGMDMCSPYGVYVNCEQVAVYDSEDAACKHYNRLLTLRGAQDVGRRMHQLTQSLSSLTMVTMTSREMADLTEKRHDSVKRTIDTLAEKGVINAPQIVEYLDSLGRPANEYQIGKRDSFVIVAQLSPEFMARLVDRWQELEAQQDSVKRRVTAMVAGHNSRREAAQSEVAA